MIAAIRAHGNLIEFARSACCIIWLLHGPAPHHVAVIWRSCWCSPRAARRRHARLIPMGRRRSRRHHGRARLGVVTARRGGIRAL
jgi:hypothetical protein